MKRIFALLSVLGFMACQNQNEEITQTIEQPDPTVQKKEVRAFLKEYVSDMKNLNIDAAEKHYSQKDSVVLAGRGTLIYGHDNIDNFFKAIPKDLKETIKMEIHDSHINILAPNAAAASIRYEWEVLTQMNDTLQWEGVTTYAMKKNENGWRIVQSSGSYKF